ncbi:bestrohin chloride channel-like protein [Formosa agariphila KMM 3901]|uniref:Bestrohin chloride channel-like protein n=2 Tax=Formosa TaxID=225842 RepID=T2KLK6_FORAG|nr:bestrohin chloride channel-like protein [Formosa agariphila KMM 3901]
MVWSLPHYILISIFMGAITLLYHYKIISVTIPWLPISVIGTAVAFYVGFKNNQAYDRLWEARKTWGGIINDSRSWGMMVDGFVTNQFTTTDATADELKSIKKRLIYRHIAWLYAHRSQLLISTPWEGSNQRGFFKKRAKYLQKKFGIGLLDDEITKTELHHFLPENEYSQLVNTVNTATQIINQQSKDLTLLREASIIEDFRHMELTKILQNFYTLQGKNERIKKFPLPRQYANMSRVFVFIFIFLIPFSMTPELMKAADWSIWLSIPLSALIGWVYRMMELVGDYSENPFQSIATDIPMMSICRTIEIDLREMLGETDLPLAINAKKDVLM